MMNKHESTPLPQNLPTDGKKKPHRHKAKRVIKIALAVCFAVFALIFAYTALANATYEYVRPADYLAVKEEMHFAAEEISALYRSRTAQNKALQGNALELCFNDSYDSCTLRTKDAEGNIQELEQVSLAPALAEALEAINNQMVSHRSYYVMFAPKSIAMNRVVVDDTEVMLWFGRQMDDFILESGLEDEYRGSGFSLPQTGQTPHLQHETGGYLPSFGDWYWVKQQKGEKWFRALDSDLTNAFCFTVFPALWFYM